MRTATIHLFFAAVTVLLLGIVATLSYRLQQAESLNRSISADVAGTLQSAYPEVALSRALAMARNGEYENALKGYKALVDTPRAEVSEAALYNLGNLHLRQAIKQGAAGGQALPLVELAKQSYRDLLRRNPNDWDARYNLELALRLSPEVTGENREDEGPPMAKERAVTTMRGGKIDLP